MPCLNSQSRRAANKSLSFRAQVPSAGRNTSFFGVIVIPRVAIRLLSLNLLRAAILLKSVVSLGNSGFGGDADLPPKPTHDRIAITSSCDGNI